MDIISVIVPVYNAESTLKRTINSIINQTYHNLQIILINDGSTDNSLKICNDFVQSDNRISVFTICNSGVSAAREFGLQKVIGKYIIFCDADDYMNSDMIEIMYKVISNTNVELIVCGFNNCRNDKALYNREESIIACLTSENIGGYLWNKMFCTDIVRNKQIHFNKDIYYCEDLDFVIKYIININKMLCINFNLYNHINTPTSITNGSLSWERLTSLKSRLSIYELLLENNLLDSANVCQYTMIKQAVYIGRELQKVRRNKNLQITNKQFEDIWNIINTICHSCTIKQYLKNKNLNLKVKFIAFIYGYIKKRYRYGKKKT